jgi:hypothetical protein
MICDKVSGMARKAFPPSIYVVATKLNICFPDKRTCDSPFDPTLLRMSVFGGGTTPHNPA